MFEGKRKRKQATFLLKVIGNISWELFQTEKTKTFFVEAESWGTRLADQPLLCDVDSFI